MGEQLLLDFMNERVMGVISLGYRGGQDEHLGGFCEPLVIKYGKGPDDFILCQMYQTDFEEEGVRNNYLRIRFHSLEEMMRNWKDDFYSLVIDENRWEKTDSVCGYDVDAGDFNLRLRKESA